MSNLVRVCISLEQELFDAIERMNNEGRYANRSEVVRDLIRQHERSNRFPPEAEVIGTLSLIYHHHERNLSRRLHQVQHQFHHQVLAATHVHLSHDLCAEMIMLRGAAGDLERIATNIRTIKGVLDASLMLGDCPSIEESHEHAHR